MAINRTRVGLATAYGYAKAGGYQGTEAEFEAYLANASTKAGETVTNALKAEGYATGKQNGQAVPSTSPYYNANAAYYSQHAATSATNAYASETNCDGYLRLAQTAASNASASAQAADASASTAWSYLGTAKGWAVGSSDSSDYSDVNNAKYYASRAQINETNSSEYASSASNSATDAAATKAAAETARDDANAWATGQKRGIDVPSTDPAYHNNARYYSILMSGMLDEFDSVLENANIRYCIGGATRPADDDPNWSASVTPSKGDYVWQRTIYTWADGTITKSYTVSYLGIDGTGAVHSINTLVGDVVLDGSNINVDASAATPVTIGTAIAEKADKADTVLSTTLSRGRNTALGTGTGSFAFGNNVQATANYSHAEGSGTAAREANAHAEGSMSTASGAASHAEGYYSTASGSKAHAEGSSTEASGVSSHAEGTGTIASLSNMHASGAYNTEQATFSAWVAGTQYTRDVDRVLYDGKAYQCITTNFDNVWTSSHWKEIPFTGEQLFAIGNGSSVSERSNAMSLNIDGDATFAGGLTSNGSFVMNGAFSNGRTGTVGGNSFASGWQITASGSSSHAEGVTTTASSRAAHAEGISTAATGESSHAEGSNSTASGSSAHAEGYDTTASGIYSHAEGYSSLSSGNYSHADGVNTIAPLYAMHACGAFNTSPVIYSNWVANTQYEVGDKVRHNNGSYICKTANNDSLFSTSKWTAISFTGDDLFVVGNGSYYERSNAMTLTWEGDATFARDIYSGSKKVSGHTQLFDSHTDGVNAGYITNLNTTDFTYNSLKCFRAGDVITITGNLATKNAITSEKSLFNFSIKPTYVNFVSIFDNDYKQISGASIRIAVSNQLLSLAVTNSLSGVFRFNLTFICDD